MNFQHRSTVTLSSVQNHQKSTKNSVARPFMARNRVAQNASNARTSRSWMTTSAYLKERSSRSVKYCRVTSPTTSVAKRVSAQGWRLFLFVRFWLKINNLFDFYRQANEPAKFLCSNTNCGVASFKVPGCINLYGDLNECCSTSIVCGKTNGFLIFSPIKQCFQPFQQMTKKKTRCQVASSTRNIVKVKSSFPHQTHATNVFVTKISITRQSPIILTVANSIAKLTCDINHSFNVDVCQFSKAKNAVRSIGSVVSFPFFTFYPILISCI